MRWATLFGSANGIATRTVSRHLERWCAENYVELTYKELTAEVRTEYNVTAAPTLRYFDTESVAPRVDVVGENNIKTFLAEQP